MLGCLGMLLSQVGIFPWSVGQIDHAQQSADAPMESTQIQTLLFLSWCLMERMLAAG